jgi:hypothetical protein
VNARLWWLGLTLALAWGTSSHAAAQVPQTRRTIGFEDDCRGGATPGVFLGSYKTVPGALFAPCGISSVTSGGTVGQQQLVDPLIPSSIAGITGNVALAGAYDVSSLAPLVIVFAPPVNEVAFDALDIDNPTGLRIALAGPGGVAIEPTAAESPTAPATGIVRYERKSTTPIERVTVSYSETVALGGDGWFLDQLSYNVWACGDGELESDPLNPKLEACDDGNPLQCDGCDNTCKVSIPGCFDGASSTCIAFGTTLGCAECNMATAPVGGNIPTTPRPASTACDDGAFCTVADACDGAGKCIGMPNGCDDSLVCTKDSCNESVKACLHAIEDKWCLIAGVCAQSGEANPANKCETCNPSSATTAWAKQPLGFQCGDPVCSGAMETAASSCDANGVCVPGPKSNCQFGTCASASSCTGLCTSDQNCVEQAHCLPATQACVPDAVKATACTRNAECASNFCVDGVCCDKVCNGACESCNLPDRVGTCSPLSEKAVDPENRCPTGQFCSADGKCAAEPPVVVTPPPPLPPPPPVPPAPPADVRAMGTGCTADAQCGSGLCRDAVCCDRACDGVCESCNVPGKTPGQCSPYALGDDPENECGGAGAICSGESACTAYETRGNGLCAASPGAAKQTGTLAYACLLTLALLLLPRRRVARRARRGARSAA